MFKKILIATDGSEYSRRAFEAAVASAKCFGAEIELLFVFKQPRNYGTFSGLSTVEFTNEQVEEISNRIFNATVKDIDHSGINVERKVMIGSHAATILSEAKNGVDLIVMGSRGHSLVSGAVIGSVTQKVLSVAACPVMVVK
jgi:nucleotide-binding universal stress UspA family protein